MKVYELGFGAACGLCACIFVKKSACMVPCMVALFLLGELFIVLQVGQSPLEHRRID